MREVRFLGFNKKKCFYVLKRVCPPAQLRQLVKQLDLEERGEDYIFEQCIFDNGMDFMAKRDNCVSIHIKHIQWRSDS